MKWLVSIAIVVALVAGLWWMEQQRQAELAPDPLDNGPVDSPPPEPRYPLPRPEPQSPPTAEEQADRQMDAGQRDQAEKPEQASRQPPLPDLAESDEPARQVLSDLLGDGFVARWVKPEFLISRTVATVTSLDGDAPSLKTWPLAPLESEPLTEQQPGSDTLLWTPGNAARYAAMVSALQTVPPDEAAQLYGRYYPLFEQAWDELGESEPYFNDRLIDIIDHLLAAPDVELPFAVVPYEGRLHFAEQAQQEASWGHKLLMRMGPEHAERVKAWLRDFRAAVLTPDGPGAE